MSMNKKIISISLALAVVFGGTVSAAPDFGGKIDRTFTEDRTMYYIELDSDKIPDISIDGYTTLSKAEKIYKDGAALLKSNVTILENNATGKKYRFAFTHDEAKITIEEVNISPDGKMTVKGKADSEHPIKIFILKPTPEDKNVSYRWTDVTANDSQKYILDIIEVAPSDIANDDILVYSFANQAKSGAYSLYIVSEDMDGAVFCEDVFYAAQSDVDDALEKINALCKNDVSDDNSAKIVELIDEKGGYLYLDPTYYSELSDFGKRKVAEYMANKTGYADVKALNEAYKNAVAPAYANDGKDIEKVVESYKDSLNLKMIREYGRLSKKAIVSKSCKEAKSVEEFKKLFNCATVLEMINEATAPNLIDDAIRNYSDILELSDGAVTKYNNYKSKVLAALSEKAGKYTKVSEIEDTINSVNVSQGGSSGNNGNSGSKSVNVSTGSTRVPQSVIPQITNPQKEPDSEIQQNTDFPFVDCENVPWAKNAIEHMVKNKIVSGKTETEFYPNDKIKREEFAKITVNGFGFTDQKKTGFEDVLEGSWYEEYINAAFAAGLISGIDSTHFGVGKFITREDMATMIYRAVKSSKFDTEIILDGYERPELSDLDEVSDYAKDAVEFLIEKGAINGSNGKFNPKGYATRAEAVKVIYQIIKIR